jgi:hypothetical protein
MAIKTRNELKSYFVKNAIPTEGNFADLVDSLFIQAQDGVYKSDTQPLSVTAAPGDQKRVLRLYKAFPQTNPDWTIALTPTEAGASASGLGIVNAAGSTRVFVHDSGRVGIGTLTPQQDLSVAGSLGVGGVIVPSVGNAETKGIQFPADPGGGGGGDRAFIRYFVEAGERTKLLIGNNNDPDDRVSFMQAGAERLTIYDGKVGINQLTPTHALHVAGDAYISGPLYFVPSSDPHYKLELFAWPGSAAVRVKGFGAVALATGSGDIVTVTTDRVGINSPAPAAALDVTARSGTWGGWLEGIRFSRPEHSAITHPGGKLLFGLHSDRNFYFADTNGAGRYLMTISAATGVVGVLAGRLESPNGVKANEIGLGTQLHGATSYPYETIQMNPGHNLRLWYGPTERFVFTNDGAFWTSKVKLGNKWMLSGVGDGHANDDWLRVFNAAGNDYYGGLAAGKLWSSSGTLSGSDRRLKRDIAPLEGALEKILSLDAVSYRLTIGEDGPQIGLIGQDVERVFPEVVGEGPGGMKAIDYSRLVAPLIEAVKRLHTEVQQLRALAGAR